MRAALLVLVLVAACSPDIATGSYYCGPEELCPPDQTCDGPTNSCVAGGTEQAFVCDPCASSAPPGACGMACDPSFPGSCPDGFSCNASSSTCDSSVLHEPDDTIDQAFALPPIACPSTQTLVPGCLAAGDSANWLSFVVPAGCASIDASVQVTFPTAFEQLGLELWQTDNGPTMLATDTSCGSGVAGPGESARCLTQPIASSGHYAVLVKPVGGDCGGACGFNRYGVGVQIVTP